MINQSFINNEFMNIFKSLRIYATQSGKLYNSLKLWSESVSSDLNESSMTCYPNGFTGFSFGDRLNAVIYITLAYLHRKIFYEECPENNILPMPETDYDYWKRIIESSIEAQHLSSSKNPKYNELLSDLFGAVYDYCDWQSFISSTIGYFEDDDDETVKAFSFMFSKYHTYTDDFNYQVRDLLKEEIDFLNHSTFYKFGLFDFILPQSVENDFEDIPFIDRLYRRLYFPVWDKNSKYKHGDIVSVDENSQVIYSKSDACLILI